jgi:hypothetical protein
MDTNKVSRPEEIEAQIEELKKQLKKSREHYQYTFLCNDSESDEMIGFFNIGKAKKILTALNNGHKLELRHSFHGIISVWMNPQRNRILVKPSHLEDSVMNFIIWCGGEWYIDNEK